MAKTRDRDQLFANLVQIVEQEFDGKVEVTTPSKGAPAKIIRVTIGDKSNAYTVSDTYDFSVAGAYKAVLRGIFCNPQRTLVAEDAWPDSLKALTGKSKKAESSAQPKPHKPKTPQPKTQTRPSAPKMPAPPQEACYTVPSTHPKRPVVVVRRRQPGRYEAK